MCSVSFSDLKPQIQNHLCLSLRRVQPSSDIDELILSCYAEMERLSHFNYLYKAYTTPPDFLAKRAYADFLAGTTGVILCAVTLGAEIYRRISQLSRTDLPRAIVLDACANVYLEAKSDAYEKTIADNLTYRFCPGYDGSSTEDLKYIFDLLHPEKIGITLEKTYETYIMLPTKSMAGIIGIGKSTTHKTCDRCVMLPFCRYREEGKRCYRLEKK